MAAMLSGDKSLKVASRANTTMISVMLSVTSNANRVNRLAQRAIRPSSKRKTPGAVAKRRNSHSVGRPSRCTG